MDASTNIPEHWQIKRLAGSLGAEIIGADICKPSVEDIVAVKALLLQHMVIFLPSQSPSIYEHVALGSEP